MLHLLICNFKDTLLGYALQILDRFKYLIVTNKHSSVKAGAVDKWDTVLLGGLIGSLFSLLQFIVSPMIGRLSDRLGRKRVLLYTMVGNILSTLIWLFARNFNLFLLARVIAGLSEGNVQISTSIISDVTTPEKRSKSLALVGIAFALAFTIGPALGAWFASIDLSELCPSLVQFGIYPYSMAALVGLVLLSIETFYLYIALPETLHYRQMTEQQAQPKPKQPITLAMIHRRLLDLTYLKRIMCVFSFLFSGMEFTLVFLTFDVLDYSHMQQGKLLCYMGVMSALIQGGYVRRRVQSVGEKMIAVQGMVACVLGLYCLAHTVKTNQPVYWLYAGVSLLSFTSGTVVNCLTSLASLQCHEEHVKTSDDPLTKGRAMGEFRSYGQLGRAIGPIATCGFYWVFGPGACYAFGALAMVGCTWTTVLTAPSNKPAVKKNTQKTE
ncbi:major facilitator superfamily domain-containing protein [Choanephora cucurbitarum]|nr:major facilitator superfamily domain-containing protein [Choanephora cucurbitarum]